MATKEELQAHSVVLSYLGGVYLEPPSREFIDGIAKEDLFAHWPLDGMSPSDFGEGLKLLNQFCRQWHPRLLEGLTQDYIALFIGLEHTLAPPYESVYLSRDHIMFERQTLDVRNYYKRAKLEVPNLHKEPDDHIGYELQFAAFLCASEAKPQLDELSAFLDRHLFKWAFQFSSRIIDHAACDYYKGHAILTAATLQSLGHILKLSIAPSQN